jgi:phage terminase small subunit
MSAGSAKTKTPELREIPHRVTTEGRPPAPEHLRPETAAWWEHVTANWALDEHHLRLLRLAAEAWDRTQQAREALDEKGLTYLDRFGAPRSRPEIAVERDNKLIFARLLSALDLDAEPPAPPLALRPYKKRG